MITVIYATTSGASEMVAQEMVSQIGQKARLVNLRSFEGSDDWGELSADLVIAGGPTYGKGDWHYLWEKKFDWTLPILVGAKRVALFGLGDARFHGHTFCGGLGRLYDAVVEHGIHPVGETTASKYLYAATPSLRQGRFPGLVIDFKQDRRLISAQVELWLATLGIRKPWQTSHSAAFRNAAVEPVPLP